jgi:hypothetical protein
LGNLAGDYLRVLRLFKLHSHVCSVDWSAL